MKISPLTGALIAAATFGLFTGGCAGDDENKQAAAPNRSFVSVPIASAYEWEGTWIFEETAVDGNTCAGIDETTYLSYFTTLGIVATGDLSIEIAYNTGRTVELEAMDDRFRSVEYFVVDEDETTRCTLAQQDVHNMITLDDGGIFFTLDSYLDFEGACDAFISDPITNTMVADYEVLFPTVPCGLTVGGFLHRADDAAAAR